MKPKKPYDHRWGNLSRRFLANHPVCATKGCGQGSAHADHIQPVKVAPYRRLDETNLQALCHACHNRITAAYERGSLAGACDEDGLPLDPSHPWQQVGNAAATVVANIRPKPSPFIAARIKAAVSKPK